MHRKGQTTSVGELDALILECHEHGRFFELEGSADQTELLQRIQQIVHAISTGKTICLDLQIRRSWWLQIVEQVDQAGPGALLITQRLPADWPAIQGLRVIQTPYSLLDWNEQIRLSRRPPIQYHRSVQAISHSFIMPTGSADRGRSQIQRQSEILGISDRALTSVPATRQGQLSEDPDPWCLDLELQRARPAKWIEADRLPDRTQSRYDHSHNAQAMIRHHQSCHFAVAMDPNPDWMDGNGYITEKMLWAFWAGVPVIWFANPEKRSQLESWGFRDSTSGADDVRHPSQTRPITGWIRELSVLERITGSAVAQRWQDAQGERVAENYRRVQVLSDLIREHSWQQWRAIHS